MSELVALKEGQIEDSSVQLAAAAATNDQISSDNEAKASEILDLNSQLAGKDAETTRLEGQVCQLEGAVELEVTARAEGEATCQRLSEEVTKLNEQLTITTKGNDGVIIQRCDHSVV